MGFQINICNILWFTAILYTFIYTCAMLYVIIVNRCRFNCSNKGVILTFWLIFALTLAGSSIIIGQQGLATRTCKATSIQQVLYA